jgi:hypothetical protein
MHLAYATAKIWSLLKQSVYFSDLRDEPPRSSIDALPERLDV